MAQKVNPIAVRQRFGHKSARVSDSNWFSDYYYSTLCLQDYQIRYYLNRVKQPLRRDVGLLSCGFRPARCVIHHSFLWSGVFCFLGTKYRWGVASKKKCAATTPSSHINLWPRDTKNTPSGTSQFDKNNSTSVANKNGISDLGSVCCANNYYLSHLQSILSNYTGCNTSIVPIQVPSVYQSASLLAQAICYQLEQTKSFRQISKTIMKEMERFHFIKGIRIACSGRLNGAEIAKTECQKYGQTSLHVFSDRIDYASVKAFTPYGILGVKVWISYKSE
jgi:ribosomal protein S3